MSAEIAIRVEDVKKSFKIYYDRNRTLKDILATPGRGEQKVREVLNGISFQVKRGEAIALIGRNGCGKSTMLKLLTKIIYPDSGNIYVDGKVSSLLELGAGFHPDMSGRENIYLNASVFGLTKKEIDKKVDEIIRFSELEKFIDNPVRTYSSGMYMRLAFSVAINVKAEILLIDEILGVGDVNFQRKCFDKLKEIKSEGTTIVIVSHSMSQIEKICERCIWISDGVIKEEGPMRLVGEHYYAQMEAERLGQIENAVSESRTANVEAKNELPAFCDKNAVRSGGEQVSFGEVDIYDQKNEKTKVFQSGDTLVLSMRIRTVLKEPMVNLTVNVCNEDNIFCFGTSFYAENGSLLNLMDDDVVVFKFNQMELLSGKYSISVGLYTKEGDVLDEIKGVKEFWIHSNYGMKENGIYHMEHEWILNDAKGVISG